MTLLDTDAERGQVGIGTLVIFIALVLVAAVAASTLIDTAGLLQGRAESTGDQSSAQVTNQIDIVSGSIEVDHSGSNPQAAEVRLVVKKAPGSEALDLSAGTMSYRSQSTSQQLTHATGTAGTEFTVSGVKGVTNNRLDENSDRAEVVFDVSAIDTDGLEESESATVQYTTSSGGTSSVQITMPGTVPSSQTYVEINT